MVSNTTMETQRGDISQDPTRVIILSNMFSLEGLDFASDPKYFSEIRDEVQAECAKYAEVLNVLVESSSDGNIWVKFKEVEGSKNARNILDGKIFRNKQVICSYGKEESYNRREIASEKQYIPQ